MKPHKHCELIKAWADGAKIQEESDEYEGFWFDQLVPTWLDSKKYRIKPEPVVLYVNEYKDVDGTYFGTVFERKDIAQAQSKEPRYIRTIKLVEAEDEA